MYVLGHYKMAQSVNTLASKVKDLSAMLGTRVVEEGSHLYMWSSNIHTCAMAPSQAQKHI